MSAIVKPPTREQQAQQIAWLEAEIERLRHNEAFHVERAAAQDAEIERLTAALSVAGLWRDLGEENKRLKAALRMIAGEQQCPDNLMSNADIARAALEGDEALFPTKKICPECGQPMREGGYCDHIPF